MSIRRDFDNVIRWLQYLDVKLDDAYGWDDPAFTLAHRKRAHTQGRKLIEKCIEAVMRIEKDRYRK